VVVHLASISSSHCAFKNPVKTLKSNGLLTAQLCEIIHTKGWTTKLFNASSSEIYKGHIDYEVQEDDSNTFHLHPYSIAKIMGQSIVDFYRKTYDLPFSNGIIFTTESHLKRPDFLLNKVAAHIKAWKNGKHDALKVGNLDSYRNILHASDVANAIHIIVLQEKGETYLVCDSESHQVVNLVQKLYTFAGFDFKKNKKGFFDKNTGLQILEIEDIKLGFDTEPTNIRGEAKKLKNLGWRPSVSIDNILKELI